MYVGGGTAFSFTTLSKLPREKPPVTMRLSGYISVFIPQTPRPGYKKKEFRYCRTLFQWAM
jgi:hypothetical protein